MGSFRTRLTAVSGLTLASRILGLVRDVLLFAVLGNGVVTSAFLLAFTLPNLFRRLLGEGALSSSSIPVLSEVLHTRGKRAAFALLNKLLGWLFILLVILQALVIFALSQMDRWENLPERWYTGADLSMILFPYMGFICLSALLCGMLNVLNRFGLAAANQIWLNLAMIASLLVGFGKDVAATEQMALFLCAGVLIGGMLQFLVPAFGLKKEGWQLERSHGIDPYFKRVLVLFAPGVLGAALFQINILVSRLLAFSLDNAATGLLYIASRLVELPLGIFGIAIATVLFPELSAYKALGDGAAFKSSFLRALRLTLTITLPATLGLVLLAEPILAVLFQWGYFASTDVALARPVVQAAAAGLPFFAVSALLTRAWYAIQNLRRPAQMAAVLVVANLVFGLIFMQFWGAVGLALSNVISSALHCVLLIAFFPSRLWVGPSLRTVITCLLGLLAIFCTVSVFLHFGTPFAKADKLATVILLSLTIPVAVGAYFVVLVVGKNPVISDLRKED
jgi:putative peptidoglycan lipid II flippase